MKQSEKKKLDKENNKQVYFLSGLILLTILVFANSLSNGFTNWDDSSYIIENPAVKDFSLDKMGTMFTSLSDNIYQPLTIFSFAVEYKLAGLNPGLFHMDNLLLHIINVFLVFFLFNLITGRWEASVIIALLFGIHPLHVESVSWITERKDVLYTVFYLAGLIAYMKYFNQPGKNKFYIWTVVLFLLSIMAKPTAATFPLVLLLLDYYFNRGFGKKVILEKIPFVIISVITFIVSYINNQLPTQSEYFYPDYNVIDKFFFAFYSIAFYLVKFIAPVYLSTLYPFPMKSGGALPVWFYISPLLILGIVIFIIKVKSDFKKEIVFGSLFFLLTIAPMVQLKQIGHAITADRFTYVAYLGLFFILGKLYVRFVDLNKLNAKKYFIVAFVLFTAFFSYQTYSRNNVWKNSINLWTDVISQFPDNPIAYKNRGNALAEIGKYELSIKDFSKAIELNYRRGVIYYDRGNSKSMLNDFKNAIIDYDSSIAFRPDDMRTYYNRGLAKYYSSDFKGALMDFNKAIELDNSRPEVYNNRGLVKSYLNDSLGALQDFDKSIEINPKYGLAYLNRGNLKKTLNKLSDACDDWKIASSYGIKDASDKLKECK